MSNVTEASNILRERIEKLELDIMSLVIEFVEETGLSVEEIQVGEVKAIKRADKWGVKYRADTVIIKPSVDMEYDFGTLIG